MNYELCYELYYSVVMNYERLRPSIYANVMTFLSRLIIFIFFTLYLLLFINFLLYYLLIFHLSTSINILFLRN